MNTEQTSKKYFYKNFALTVFLISSLQLFHPLLMATYEVLYIFVSFKCYCWLIKKKHYEIHDWFAECANIFLQLLLCLEAFFCMLTQAVCFSYCYFFHCFTKFDFIQLSRSWAFVYSNCHHYSLFPKTFV